MALSFATIRFVAVIRAVCWVANQRRLGGRWLLSNDRNGTVMLAVPGANNQLGVRIRIVVGPDDEAALRRLLCIEPLLRRAA